jgi:hypothetical protein
MSKEITKKELSKRPVKRLVSPSHTSVYANNAEIMLSPWDFRIRLGQIQKADQAELVVEDTATVYMSPTHMKAFMKAITANIEKYERLFGVIKEPELIAKHLEAEVKQ